MYIDYGWKPEIKPFSRHQWLKLQLLFEWHLHTQVFHIDMPSHTTCVYILECVQFLIWLTKLKVSVKLVKWNYLVDVCDCCFENMRFELEFSKQNTDTMKWQIRNEQW